MNTENVILSDIIIFQKYAKYLSELKRRETWGEICNRYQYMMIEKYPTLKEEIITGMQYVKDKKVLSSMRALQFAGEPIRKNHSRIFNCAYLPIDDYRSFGEVMFLLLSGTGVGYSVQFDHIDKLPRILKPIKKRKFLIGDSIEGWADAVKALMRAYLDSKPLPIFDFSDIRPKGARLVTAGGKAPGPEPLKIALVHVQAILDRKENGEKLKSIEAHDILCHIANAVLAGGIRRAAMISLFSIEDEEMFTCKYGNWWELNEQRGRANNSVVIERSTIDKEKFLEIWKKIELSNCGEPGIYWTNDNNLGTNPCCEISLKAFQFCNLTEVNVSDVSTQDELNKRVRIAAFFGTLQAGFTDFHYLRSIWKETTDKEALIGVGMTGIASGEVLKLNLAEAAELVKNYNKQISSFIGINSAARTTTIKPSGTTSLVLGTSSGIHAWHSSYYIRRMRIGKNEALYIYLKVHCPELIEDDYFKPTIQAIISIPQKAPESAILRSESALDLLERVKKFNLEWVKTGHRKGENTNNVSATISVDVNEWESVGQWMWNNKKTFHGLSVLPKDNGTYVQAPFTVCTQKEYDKLNTYLKSIDLTQVFENDDTTDQKSEAACAGGACEIV